MHYEEEKVSYLPGLWPRCGWKSHILLHWGHYNSIREAYLPQYLAQNKFISEILDVEDKILLSILDPLSSKLPDSVTKSWLSPNQVYKLSRQLCFNIHSKRKKLYDDAKKLSWRVPPINE